VVGPGEGAKPREIYFKSEIPQTEQPKEEENSEEESWRKV